VEIFRHHLFTKLDIEAKFKLERMIINRALHLSVHIQSQMKKTDTFRAPKSVHRGEILSLAFKINYSTKSL
jgi:hypothetical protein